MATASSVASASAPVAQAPARRGQLSDDTIKRLFILPTLILLILWNVFPLFYSLYLSFTRYSHSGKLPPIWVGTANYSALLANETVWHSFAITGKYALLSVSLQAIVGFTLAMILHKKFKGSGLLTTLILIPMMLSPVVVGLFWKLIYNPLYGIFGLFPKSVPVMLEKQPLWSVVITDVWMWSPFVMLLVLSGLKAIPDYLYEAAVIDRASSWFQFRRITLPQVAPLLLIAILFRTMEAFKSFDLIMGLTGGGPGEATRTVSIEIYLRAFGGQFRTGSASALAYLILIVIIAASNLYITAINRIREG